METQKQPDLKRFTLPVLFVLILAQAVYTSCVFGFHKEGLHSDEAYSYGLSNSYYQPFVLAPESLNDLGTITLNYDAETETYELDLSQCDMINCFTWTDGSVFSDYLTVNPGERFAYDSVLYNQRLDVHPPLYYLLLHTICSFFPGRFSLWYAFVINLFCLVGTQIFLFLTARRLSKSDGVALLVCLLYGAGAGALSTFLFLRQYALETMLCMGYTYFAVRVISRPTEDSCKSCLPDLTCAALMALAAFFTHYSAVAYIGCLTALYCLYLLCHKRIRKMFLFGGAMLCAFLLFLALWPYLQYQTGSYDSGGTLFFSHWTQVKMLLRYFCRYCLGFSIRVLPSPFWRITLPLVAFGLFAFGMLLIPFRDEIWCQNLIARIKALPKRMLQTVINAKSPLLFILPAALSLYPVTGYATNIPKMGNFVVRYLFPSFPLLCMAAVLIVHAVLIRLPRMDKLGKILLIPAVVAALISSHVHTASPFLMPNFGETQDYTEKVTGKNVAVITSTFDNLFSATHCLAPYLRNCAHVYITSADLLPYQTDDLISGEERIDYVLIHLTSLQVNDENSDLAKALLAESYAYSQQSYNMANFLGIADDLSETELARLAEALPEYFSIDDEDTITLKNDCTPIIQSLNGGCEYRIVCGLNVQGVLFYVLELY